MKMMELRPATYVRAIAARTAAFVAIFLIGISSFLALPLSAQVQRARTRIATPPAALLAAANQGDVQKSVDLALGYQWGSYGKRDMEASARWFSVAAQRGSDEAKARLGALYLSGYGAPRDPKTGVALIKSAADRGDRVAQRLAGLVYGRGTGVPRDYAKASSYLSRAVDNGDAKACDYLGTMYLYGMGTGPDPEKAAELFRRGARLGDHWAQFHLGQLYQRGIGVASAPDYEMALDIFTDAAGRGNRRAAYELAKMYFTGQGADKDTRLAYYYYRVSAKKGYVPAQRVLGMLNEKKGPSRFVYAYAWYALASARRDSRAKARLDILSTKLSNVQLQAAQSLAIRLQAAFQEN